MYISRKVANVIFLSMVILGMPTLASANGAGTIIFSDDFESGDTSTWDYNGASSQYQVVSASPITGTYSLRLQHTNGGGGQNSVQKGFGDNVESTHFSGEARVNHVAIELNVGFSAVNWPSGSSTKILTIESWPDTSWPSTAAKDFQAILEMTSNTGELVVTIKREDWDFPYTYYSGVSLAANTPYKLKLEVGLDQPYTAQNGIVRLWIDDVKKIDVTDGDFILTSRDADLPRGLNCLLMTGYVRSGEDVAKYQWWDNVILSVPAEGDPNPLPPSNLRY
jgi:hypothetical protein